MFEELLAREIFLPILIIFFSILTYVVLKYIIKRALRLKIQRIDVRKQKALIGLISALLRIFIFLVALMMILDVYGIDTKSLVTSLGVASLVIGLALQDLIRDFIVGFTVLLEDQFSVGDVVTINNFTGTVIATGLKTTRLKSFAGEVKIISNRSIVELTNHSLEIAKAIIDINVEKDSDILKVKDILNRLCAELSEELSLIEKAECVGVEAIGNIGIQFRIIITTKFSDRAVLSRTFRERIKEALDKEKIAIAYPQLVTLNG